MKITIKKQFNKLGDSFLAEKEVEIEINKSNSNDMILLEMDNELLQIPVEVFWGVLEKKNL